MRIVGGEFRGRSLSAPRSDAIRPTSDRTREAVFNVLAHRFADRLEGARVLDLFAGTGALGLEALSRGARPVDFVEFRPSSLHALKANVAALHVRERPRVFKRDALPFSARLPEASYDIAFADPPYGSRMLDRLIEIWLERRFSRILTVEHGFEHELPPGGASHPFETTVVTIYGA